MRKYTDCHGNPIEAGTVVIWHFVKLKPEDGRYVRDGAYQEKILVAEPKGIALVFKDREQNRIYGWEDLLYSPFVEGYVAVRYAEVLRIS